MKTFLSLLLCSTLLQLSSASDKDCQGFIEVGAEIDSNPQQYGDTSAITTSNKRDEAFSAMLHLDYNYRPSENWIGRHSLNLYEIRYNTHDDLNFRALSFKEDFRTPVEVFGRKGYFQNRFKVNYYGLDDNPFLWGGEIRPELSLLHKDADGAYRFGFHLDHQMAIKTLAEDFEGQQFGFHVDLLRKIDLANEAMVKSRIAFKSYNPDNAIYEYDEWSLQLRAPMYWGKQSRIQTIPFLGFYDRSYDRVATTGREDDGVLVGVTAMAQWSDRISTQI